MAEAAGAKAEVLRAMGGSANSLLWTQIKADVTGKAVVVPASDTATTLGAAILAGVGVGFYKDYEEAVSWYCTSSFATTTAAFILKYLLTSVPS